MLTIASQDQAFEFHVKLDQVSKISLVVKETPPPKKKIMRIIRLLNNEQSSLASLILVGNDADDAAGQWFENLQKVYGGSEIEL